MLLTLIGANSPKARQELPAYGANLPIASPWRQAQASTQMHRVQLANSPDFQGLTSSIGSLSHP
jgi:hypothetical protein